MNFYLADRTKGDMAKLFGTDGIRGIYGKFPIIEDMAYRVGRAVALHLGKLGGSEIIISGRDTRFSGETLEKLLLLGIRGTGLSAISAGIIPTPGIAYLVKSRSALGGVVISASHNPAQYNGFKVFNAKGYKISEKDEEGIETLILSHNEQEQSIPDSMQPQEEASLSYSAFLKASCFPDHTPHGMKMVIDCANGATYKIAPILFQELGADVYTIHHHPDGININEDCGTESLASLKDEVIKRKADIGLAFDGDGDRVVAITEKGKALTGDHIIAICTKMFKEMDILGPDIVVSTVMSNIGLTMALKEMGISHIRTNVGDRNVCEAMREKGAIIGGEESGHIIFLNRHTTGDGMLSAIYLLCAVSYFEKPLSELSHIITLFPQVKINVKVAQKPPISSVPEISNRIKEIESVLGDRGRVLVRYSGTEPVCRIMVEGEDRDRIQEYAISLAHAVEKKLNPPLP
jgi:phosphoglucosamine mutase